MLSRATARSLLDTPEELPTARKLIKIFQPCPGRDNEVFAQVSCMPSSEGKQLHTCMPADKNPVDENERYWAVELDLEPFKAHFPVMTRPSSIGDGVRFLNRCRMLSHRLQMIPHCSWCDMLGQYLALLLKWPSKQLSLLSLSSGCHDWCWPGVPWDVPEQHVFMVVCQTHEIAISPLWRGPGWP